MRHLKAIALLCGLGLLVVPLDGCSLFEKKTTPYEGYAFLDMCHTTHSRDVRIAHWS